ncbi:MAG: sigma 54-interacting transcriptional regulator [Thermodesulfobacteriota bacterium]
MTIERMLIEAMDYLPCGLVLLDPEGGITYANGWAAGQLGLRGNGAVEDRGTGLPMVLARMAARCLESGRPQSEMYALDGGAPLRLEVTARSGGGRVKGLVGLMTRHERDGVWSQQLFDTLHSQELNAIFELSSDGILLSDGAGQVVKINGASERLNGWSSEEVVGRNVRDLLRDGLISRSVTLEVLETGKQVNMMQYVSRTRKHLLVTGTPLFDENGQIKLVVVNERDMTQLNAIKEKLEETQMMSEKYRDRLIELDALRSREDRIIAESPKMREALKYALKLARLDASNILLLGESGTGKGLLAKFLHNHGKRRDKPLIQINCAALPETLLEAELFGYEKGAFTGASVHGKAGLFELAQGGSLLLDEIGDCPVQIQAKLLKYLDDHEVLRLGSVRPLKIDCNIIASTNRDLEELIRAGSFRSDLYFRLNTFTIRIPPLRERPEDAFELIIHYLEEFNTRYGLRRKISSQGLKRLQAYRFPGNVRELKNMIKQALVMSEGDVLDEFILSGLGEAGAGEARAAGPPGRRLNLEEQLGFYEKSLLKKTLADCRSTRAMASYLGTSQSTVVRRLKKYGLGGPSKRN